MFEITRQAGTSSVDVKGMLTIASAVDFMQDCSIFHIDSMKSLSDFLAKKNIRIFIASRQINILRMPKYGESLKIRTWIFDISRARAYRNTVILDENENLCCSSFIIGAFVNVISGKAVLLPDQLIKKVPLYNKLDMDYLDRKIALPKINPEKSSPLTVLRYHLDYNNHVNNSKYISIASEYLEENTDISAIRIEYKTPAKYKDTLVPFIYKLHKSTIIDLCASSGASYATVEFIN